jgi:hypothetical protein
MRIRHAAALVSALLACGCGTLNVQRSALRGAGDLSCTAFLDRAPEADVCVVAEETRKIAKGLIDFLDRLPAEGCYPDALFELLRDRAGARGAWLVEGARIYCGRRLDRRLTVGPDNVKRIRAYLTGVVEACDEYDPKDRLITAEAARSLGCDGGICRLGIGEKR